MNAPDTPQPVLKPHFSLLQASALNMVNMLGVGPFISIPVLIASMAGPQAMLGWLIALMIALPDGLIWSELGAMFPGSGGSFLYLTQGFGKRTFGRLMGFLFIWQFIISGPLEIASGYIGFANYVGYLWPGMTNAQNKGVIVLLGLFTMFLLYRRIGSIGKLTVTLWVGALLTTAAVIFSGVLHFSAKIAFDFPPGAFAFSWGFVAGLGAASRVGVYDYLGYYDICYIGDEVREPGRVIPRSILISIVVVALIYFGINLSIMGVLPWREFGLKPEMAGANYVASTFMERLYGPGVAKVFTVMILWTAFASVFALLLGYSRIPYAAAKAGSFFKLFGSLHPTKHFPHISLLVMGTISIACGFVSLGFVIDALLTTRILVQFIGQIGALIVLRRRSPDIVRPFRAPVYPLVSAIALAGWVFLFVTSGTNPIMLGLGSLVVGMGSFLIWDGIGRSRGKSVGM